MKHGGDLPEKAGREMCDVVGSPLPAAITAGREKKGGISITGFEDESHQEVHMSCLWRKVSVLLAVVVGGLYTSGIYLMMRRNLVKVVIGLVLLGQAANLLIFTTAGLGKHAPLVRPGEEAPLVPVADPLPQALILTAIVIGFGVIAFTLVLFHRAYQSIGTDDLDEMRATDT
jgi:multicomponent Na+:H+ antiporter subunit C